jgi:HPt (histidine-containing phosphotransfer) domain-containing protein
LLNHIKETADNHLTSQSQIHPLLAQRQQTAAQAIGMRASDDAIDWEWLLSNYGSRSDSAELLRDYAKHIDEDNHRLAAAVTAKDLAALGAAAHTFKGALRSVGAAQAAKLASDIETAARQGQWPGDETMHKLNVAIAQVKVELSRV